jgi:hypothetical protein
MAFWAAAGIVYFVYIVVVAVLLPRLPAGRRVWAGAVAFAGLAASVWGGFAETFWVRSLILPPLVLLLSYWASGLLWTGPMPRIERWLASWDTRLHVPATVARMPRLVILLLEAAYAGVYPLIPIALGLHLWFAADPDADRFWAVVLITDFVCFGALPWIQTRPPRALDTAQPWTSGLRTFNVGLLGRLSIGVNTVPSGHAAEALAAALLLADAPVAIAVWMWIAAAAISAGAVYGRYHFAVDAVAGWLVALVVWSVVR